MLNREEVLLKLIDELNYNYDSSSKKFTDLEIAMKSFNSAKLSISSLIDEERKQNSKRILDYLKSDEGKASTHAYFQAIWDKEDLRKKKHLEVYSVMSDAEFKIYVLNEVDKQNFLEQFADLTAELRDLCEIMLEHGKEIKNPKNWGMFEAKRVKYKGFTVSVHVGQGSFYRINFGRKHIYTS